MREVHSHSSVRSDGMLTLFPQVDNLTAVRLGVGFTIGSSILAMLWMAHL